MSEKFGGSSNVSGDINKFISFLNKDNFIFLNAFGVPFTWCNGHQDNSIMFERLDRVIVNSQRLLDKIGSKLVLEPSNFLFENGIRKVGDIKIKQQILFYRLSETQKRAMKGDISILNFEKCLREELSSVLRTEEVMWAQKAKINWLKLGDRNTRFF